MSRLQRFVAPTLTAAVSLFAAEASAGTIAYEGFDYANGTNLTTGGNGGIGWSADWAGSGGNTGVEAGGYTYTGLASEGNKSILGNGILTRTLDVSSVPGLTTNGKLGKEGTSIWFSFMSRIGGWWGSANAKIGLALTDDGAQQLSVGLEGNEWVLGTVLSDGTDQTSIIDGTGPSVELFVGRIQFGSGGSTVDIWANPDLSGSAPTGGTHVTDATFQAFAFNGLQLQMDQTGATIRTDEIRVGTDFASVIATTPIPEPASMALLAAGGLLTFSRRRR